jgi:hypothetical protein
MKHLNEKKATGEWAAMCNASMPYGIDNTLCAECAAIDASRPKVAVRQISEDELDAKMRQAGFEAAGNAATQWNRLHPVNGNNF